MRKKKNEEIQTENRLENLLHLAKSWLRDIEYGKRGEHILYGFLANKGYQVLPIMHYEHEKENQIYTKEERINKALETIFAPDFLVCSKNQIFFADAKLKGSIDYLGWVNVRDYEKYLRAIEIMGLKPSSFRIYWIIDQTREIYVLDKIKRETSKFPIEPQPDGDVYTIPKKYLSFEGKF